MMNLAISNLAWARNDDIMVARLLESMNVQGVELAPTKVWEHPFSVSPAELDDYRELWRSFGIEIVAIQSLLFGRPELRVFGTSELRDQTLDYLRKMIRLAGRLGAKAMVFGSPKNRLIGNLTTTAALNIAVPFFEALANEAEGSGVVFCIEPNPVEYGTDWIVTTREAMVLVEAVAHDSFGLNIDTGGMTLSGEDPTSALGDCGPWIRHFHISEPDLAPIGTRGVDHRRFASSLAVTGFSGWQSIEMREPLPGSGSTLETAIATAQLHYGGEEAAV